MFDFDENSLLAQKYVMSGQMKSTPFYETPHIERKEMYSNHAKINKLAIYSGAVVIALILLWVFFPWKTVTVDPGQVGVYSDKPYVFGKNGVRRNEVMEPGREWVWKSTEIIPVLSVPFKQPVRIDDFSTVDNYLVDFDSTVSLRILDAPSVVADWRLTFWSESILAEYNSITRREVAKYKLYELMSNQAALQTLDQNITENLSAYLKKIGIKVVAENVALGRAKPTAEVLAQINETARQNEAKATNVQKAAAEIERKQAEKNRASADMEYATTMNISPSQFTAIRIAEMQTQACIKAANCVIGIDRITPAGK